MNDTVNLRAKARATIAVCTAIYLLDGLIHTILGPLAPDIARSLSLGKAELGPIFSSNLIGQCIGLVVFPPIADRIGHRLTIALAVLGFAVGQSASALAEGGTSLFALRLATGVFLGGCLPSCLALVTQATDPARRGLSVLILFTGYGLGAAIAGAVAAGFALYGGWRMSMIAVGAVSFVAAAAAWLALPDGRAESEPALVHGAFFKLLASDFRVGTILLWLIFASMLTISYCLNSWLPIMLVEAGHSESFAALSITIFGFGGAIAALLVGLLIDRHGAIPVLIGFTAAAAATLFAIGQMLTTASAPALIAMLSAAGFFSLGAYGGVNVVLADFYPQGVRATGIGWAKSVGRLGTVIAPILIGFALAAGVAGSFVISLFAIPALVTGVALAAISTTRPWRSRPATGRRARAAPSI
ncbi:MAG: MFS transporter [Croceibacterium sp.]